MHPAPAPITELETSVLQLICNQFSLPQIAAILRIDRAAVEQSRQSLLTKSNKKTDVGLFIYAVQNGFYNIED